jgi:co-chaperonin GroES (HSP10)
VPDQQGAIVKLEVKDGDRKIDGEELLIMKESDLLGIIANRTIKARAA